jgi:hypothetical protein
VSYSNLRTFLQAVHGISLTQNQPWIIQHDESDGGFDSNLTKDHNIGTLGYIDCNGCFKVQNEAVQTEIMRQFLFLNENKKEFIKDQKTRSRSSKAAAEKAGMFPFKPQIAKKSRDLAEGYKRTFNNVSDPINLST